MRIKHRYLTWDNHLQIIQPVKDILDRYSLPYEYHEDPNCVIQSFQYQMEFYLYEDNPAFNAAKQEISQFLQPQYIGTEYEKADVKNAGWFIVNTGEYQYPQPEAGFGYLQATFNLDNYCPLCGIGKVQNAPYRLKTEPRQTNRQFWGLHWEFEPIFVRQETKNILEQEEIKGIRFSNPVLHKKNVPIQGFYQLHIDTLLNKGFNPYNTKTITCQINNEENLNKDVMASCCGRIKFHHPMVGGYLFNSDIFDHNFDIAESNEYFGSGRSARRLQIVSKKFKDIAEKNKLKGISFTPVMHVNPKR